MDSGSSIKRAVNFIAKEAQQFPQELCGNEGRVLYVPGGFDPIYALFLFCIFPLDLDRFL